MTIAVILTIIFIGLLLVFFEIFLIPGTTLFGVIGGIALVAGIIMMYAYYGSQWGNITLVMSIVLIAVAIGAGFKVIQSNKLAMNAEIKGKVNELEKNLYHVGDKGTAISELRPNGKATFNGHKIEVFSNGEYVSHGSEIEIIKITNDKIFVKPTKT